MPKEIRDSAILNPASDTATGITGVRRQESLLKAGGLQNAIFNSANFSSIATDAKGVIQIFNVGAERMLGYTAAEVMNKITLADISDPQEVIARAKALSIELSTPITPGFEALVFKASRGIEDIYELTYIRKDGSRFPAVVSVTALRDDQGAIIGYLLIGTDNTDRKKMEEEAAHLASFPALSPYGIIEIGCDGSVRFVNPAAMTTLAQLGLDPDARQFLPGTPEELVLLRSLCEQTPQTQELHLGKATFLRVVAAPPGDDSLRVYALDITDRKKMEEEAAHLASFPALSPYGIIEIGCDGSVRFVNPAAMTTLAQLGLDPDARQFLPGTPEELVLLRSLCEQTPQTQELHLGKATFLRVVAAPPGDDSLRVYALDITDRKKMEEALWKSEEAIRALNADLEERVHRRTAELEAANKELEAFSYSVSHDLRSPLRSIDGFSQAFLEDFGSAVPEEGREDLERVRRATQRMGRLIEDMLLLSRVTRREMHVQETDMSALATDVAEELARDDPQRDVQLSIEPGMAATGDPQLLRIVLVNLLGNAWKFTSKHEQAHVSVGTVRDPEHGPAFFVRDDGAGFDAKYKEKLFVAFQRLHAQEEFPGTGIGLATIQRAVRRHGGDVWAEGEVDRGATFYFTIPDLHVSYSARGEQP
jgi:signal transduction histidine kinase